jgi:hypothetical protein
LINPLRSEGEAFRFLIYLVVTVAVILGVIALVKAIG